MELSVEVADLLIASWRVGRDEVARVLPRALEPAEVDGEHLVSLVTLRAVGGKAGRLPVPRFAQLNVRVYTTWEGKPAVCFLDMRVTPAGLGAKLVGLPVRATRIRVTEGAVDAPGLGVRLRFRPALPVDPGAINVAALGLLPLGRELRGFRVRRGAGEWHEAIATEAPRVDPLLALGFEVEAPYSLLYCAATSFGLESAPRRLAGHPAPR